MAGKFSRQFKDLSCIFSEVWIVVLWILIQNWSDDKNPWRACAAVCFYSCSSSSSRSSYIWFNEQLTNNWMCTAKSLHPDLLGSSTHLSVLFSCQIIFYFRTASLKISAKEHGVLLLKLQMGWKVPEGCWTHQSQCNAAITNAAVVVQSNRLLLSVQKYML